MSGVLAYFDERANQLLTQERYADLKKLSAEALAENPEYALALLLQGLRKRKPLVSTEDELFIAD